MLLKHTDIGGGGGAWRHAADVIVAAGRVCDVIARSVGDDDVIMTSVSFVVTTNHLMPDELEKVRQWKLAATDAASQQIGTHLFATSYTRPAHAFTTHQTAYVRSQRCTVIGRFVMDKPIRRQSIRPLQTFQKRILWFLCFWQISSPTMIMWPCSCPGPWHATYFKARRVFIVGPQWKWR